MYFDSNHLKEIPIEKNQKENIFILKLKDFFYCIFPCCSVQQKYQSIEEKYIYDKLFNTINTYENDNKCENEEKIEEQEYINNLINIMNKLEEEPIISL